MSLVYPEEISLTF